MIEYELKTWPEFWHALESGKKRFEIRYNDRGFVIGDILILREWDPHPQAGGYTGRELRFRITYIVNDPRLGLKEGYVVMSIERETNVLSV